MKKSKEVFLGCVYRNIHRKGITEFMEWLDHDTDFFTAPASTKYHGACEGGLVSHSLAVYNRAFALNGLFDLGLDKSSLAIATLFHDICKCNFYTKELKNKKVYITQDEAAQIDKSRVRFDNGGAYIWEQVEAYTVNEKEKFGGHGSKSVYLLMKFLNLSLEEAAAINCHMGAYDMSTYSKPSDVYQVNKLAFIVHLADEVATFIDET